MAMGNHLQNGNCALLVMAAKITSMLMSGIGVCLNKCHELLINMVAIPRIMATSPIRFVRAVIMPAPTEYEFW